MAQNTELYHSLLEGLNNSLIQLCAVFQMRGSEISGGAEQELSCCAGLKANTSQGPAQNQGCRVSITMQTPRKQQEADTLKISRSAPNISKLYFLDVEGPI